MNVVCGTKKWKIHRRYREFLAFHNKILKSECNPRKIPKYLKFIKLLIFIYRLCGKYYYGNLNDKRIQERKDNLNAYLQQILHVQRDILVSDKVMSAFQEFFAQ